MFFVFFTSLQFSPAASFAMVFEGNYAAGTAYVAYTVCELFSDPKGKDEATGSPDWVGESGLYENASV